MSPLRAHCWPVCQTSSRLMNLMSTGPTSSLHASDSFTIGSVVSEEKGSTCFVFTLELHFCQKCHHKERSIAAIWKPKLCCLTTVCAFFHAFAAPHVTWGRPVFPLICLLLQKEGIQWNTLFRHFILISDRSSQGYWSLTQAVIKTQFGAMGEVFCGFKQPLRFSNFFFQAISSNYRKWRQMPFTTAFAMKTNLEPSLTESLSILDKSYTWLQPCACFVVMKLLPQHLWPWDLVVVVNCNYY